MPKRDSDDRIHACTASQQSQLTQSCFKQSHMDRRIDTNVVTQTVESVILKGSFWVHFRSGLELQILIDSLKDEELSHLGFSLIQLATISLFELAMRAM